MCRSQLENRGTMTAVVVCGSRTGVHRGNEEQGQQGCQEAGSPKSQGEESRKAGQEEVRSPLALVTIDAGP